MSCGDDSGETSGNQKSLEELEYEQGVKDNESKKKNHDFDDFPKTIHKGRQGKHMKGHNNYQEGKSYITITIEEAHDLVNKFSGTGEKLTSNKERVDFGKEIGKYVDPQTGEEKSTTVGLIHYSKDGCHIVPARPKK